MEGDCQAEYCRLLTARPYSAEGEQHQKMEPTLAWLKRPSCELDFECVAELYPQLKSDNSTLTHSGYIFTSRRR